MTFTPQIRVKGHDGSLLQYHSVYLVIHGENGNVNQILTTDNNGLAAFNLDTANWNGKSVSLEVSTGSPPFLHRRPSEGKLQNFLVSLSALLVSPSPHLLTSSALPSTESFS